MKQLLLLFSIFWSGFALAQDAIVVQKGAVLFDGYDPVAYFTTGQPVKGQAEFAVNHEGRIIRFASAENKALFTENKAKYFPAYGGWCAIAMVDGLFVVPDYTFFKIQDNQLLFFQVKAFVNGKTLWEKAPEKNKLKADSYYHTRFPAAR